MSLLSFLAGQTFPLAREPEASQVAEYSQVLGQDSVAAVTHFIFLPVVDMSWGHSLVTLASQTSVGVAGVMSQVSPLADPGVYEQTGVSLALDFF